MELACLVDVVSQTFQLLHASSRLLVRIVPCTNCAHARWLVSCIALGTVVEVRVWPTGAISATVSIRHERLNERNSYTQMFPVIAMCGHRWGLHITATTAIFAMVNLRPRWMRADFTHPARRSNRPRLQFRQERLLVIVWYCADDVDQTRHATKSVLFAHLGPQFVQGDGLPGIMCLDQFCSDAGRDPEELLRL